MEGLCPLCAKNGIKKKLKAFQINFEEAVWSCESDKCPWPIGYEKLTFVKRNYLACDWNESNFIKENSSALIELSLYTPPVTPGGELSKESIEVASTEYSSNLLQIQEQVETLPTYEFIVSKESANSHKSLQFKISNPTEENNCVLNKECAETSGFKILPKITNIEKTNINLTIFCNIDESCDNKKTQQQEYSLTDTTTGDTVTNFDTSNSECTKFDSSASNEIMREQTENISQFDRLANNAKANFDSKVSEVVETLVNVDITSNLNETEKSIETDVHKIIDDIIKMNDSTPVDVNDDWLDYLTS
ncbi:hypothetical protein PUN28_012860 [Cardiocondyla obscurior]|uniref:Uncharacterized protein n=2 Tax=Cardiocondyla obscurior TaxID=286306 RepID=A0AAW2FBA6_9HYME